MIIIISVYYYRIITIVYYTVSFVIIIIVFSYNYIIRFVLNIYRQFLNFRIWINIIKEENIYINTYTHKIYIYIFCYQS